MALDELLEGTALTGRQAAIIFVTFLLLIIAAGLVLITFSDFFRELVMTAGAAGASVGRGAVAISPPAI